MSKLVKEDDWPGCMGRMVIHNCYYRSAMNNSAFMNALQTHVWIQWHFGAARLRGKELPRMKTGQTGTACCR